MLNAEGEGCVDEPLGLQAVTVTQDNQEGTPATGPLPWPLVFSLAAARLSLSPGLQRHQP